MMVLAITVWWRWWRVVVGWLRWWRVVEGREPRVILQRLLPGARGGGTDGATMVATMITAMMLAAMLTVMVMKCSYAAGGPRRAPHALRGPWPPRPRM